MTAVVDIVPRGTFGARLGTLRLLLTRADRRLLVALGGLIVVDSLAAGALAVGLKWMVNGVTDGDRTRALVAAVVAGVSSGVLGTAGRVMFGLERWISGSVGAGIDRQTLDATARAPGIEHLERPAYLDQIALVGQHGGQLMQAVFTLVDFVSLGLRIAISVWLLATVSPLLVLLPLFAVPAVLIAPRAQRCVERANVASASDRRAADHLHALFVDPAAAMELRIFGCADPLDERADRLWNQVAATRLKGAIRSTLAAAIGWAGIALGYIAALAVVVVLAGRGEATPGDLMLVSALALQLRSYLAQSTQSIGSVSGAMRLTDRFRWLVDHTQAQAGSYAGRAATPAGLERGIRVEHVSFTYPGTERAVLDDVSLDLPAGSTVAIVGENGSGKTTLVKLLCRFYDPTAGSITVDGTDLRELDVRDWRLRLAGAFQDHLRLEASARHSIGAGDPPNMGDDPRVLAALDRAHAKRQLARWEAGLDTQLGTTYADGTNLSGGQWQQVAIARGMMRPEPLLLLLDEPTAALDPVAEHALYERYATAAERTRAHGGVVVLVSHRFSSVRMADRIVVFERGRITEQGSHDELLALCMHYATMYRRQAAAYE